MPQKNHSLQRTLHRLDACLIDLQHQDSRFSNIRFLTIFIGLGLTALAYYLADSFVVSIPVAIIALGIFGYVVSIHRRIRHSMEQHTIWRQIKREHLARLTLDWEHIPAPIPPETPHPFEIDLDLGSLHQLINTTTSAGGAAILRGWLLNLNPLPDDILARQAIVHELAGMPIFRDKLILEATLKGQERREGEKIAAWLAQEEPPLRGILAQLVGLAVVNAVLLIVSLVAGLPPIWLVTWLLYVGLSLTRIKQIGSIVESGLSVSFALEKLVAVLRFIENYRFGNHPLVRQTCAPVIEQQPSKRLRSFALTVGLVTGIQQNIFLWGFLNAIMPWDIYFAYRFQQQRATFAADLPIWLDVWFRLEALTALATFADLHRDYVFPTIHDSTTPLFDAQKIGHPLIPSEKRIRNDFRLDTSGEMVIITGSNMSGKSSFLRTLGVNLCLAYAGTVVCADALTVSRLRLFTSIRISDSLDDGISYFYAEVKRLKLLLDQMNDGDPLPMFYLIDEIFRGTNNRERLIGSRSYMKQLIGGQGIGVIATHDLELTALAEASPLIHNAHFREDVRDGQMIFDYTLRTGASPTTNALKIMEMSGIPIDFQG